MPGIRTTVQPSFRDILGRFTKANKELLNDKRKMMKQLGSKMVGFERAEAPKKTGRFAKGIHYKTFVRGEIIEMRTYSPEPLGTYITKGTKAHLIVARKASALRFFWESGPRGAGIYFFKWVMHPGTKPNPYVDRAYARWYPGAKIELSRIALNYKSRVVK